MISPRKMGSSVEKAHVVALPHDAGQTPPERPRIPDAGPFFISVKDKDSNEMEDKALYPRLFTRETGWHKDERTGVLSRVPVRIGPSPEKAEQNAVAWLVELGDDDAHLTPAGTRGIDARSAKVFAQVKNERANTGVTDLRFFHDVCGDDHGKQLWYFSVGYTMWAIEFADQNSILLFKYHDTGELEAVNEIAEVELMKLWEETTLQRKKRTQLARRAAERRSRGHAGSMKLKWDGLTDEERMMLDLFRHLRRTGVLV